MDLVLVSADFDLVPDYYSVPSQCLHNYCCPIPECSYLHVGLYFEFGPDNYSIVYHIRDGIDLRMTR
jgi:hypothetical protein